MTERIQTTLSRDPDLDVLTKDTPTRIRDLLARCLHRDEQQRLSSITKARQELEEEIALRALPEVKVRREATPNNLPALVSSFVGRETQKTDVKKLLGENRLLTLTGVGGGGKTRLALEAGRELLERAPDGVWLVELAPLADPSLVPQTVTTVLGLRDEAQRTSTQILTDHLKSRVSLLILDNCEHVLRAAADLVAAVLQTCPDVRILATSREGLGVAGEVIYQVPSLKIPRIREKPSLMDLQGIEAVELFASRASEVKTGFALDEGNAAAVAQICHRLDGIPLAIELAAARVKVLPPEEILKRLDNRFRLLGSSKKTGLPHHQTLKALIDWSYDQLTEPEQTLLRRLSLFAGGWTLDAAEAVCGGDDIDEWEILDHISSLVDKSLAEVDAESGRETGKARYRMLETIREYAREQVREKDEGSGVLERHRDFFLALAEECEPGLTGREQSKCLSRLSAEHDNLRLALDMTCVPGVDPEIGWRLSGSLGRYFFIAGHWNEGRKVYEEILSRPDAARKSAAAAAALNWAGNLAKLQGDPAQAWSHLEESLAVRREMGDEAGVAASLNNLGNVAKDLGDYEKAKSLYEESLALQRKRGDKSGIGIALHSLGIVLFSQGDYARSLEFHEESLKLRREIGDRRSEAHLLNNMGNIADAMSDYDRATVWFEEGLEVQRELNDRFAIAHTLNNLGSLAERQGDFEQAKNVHLESLEIRRDLGDRLGVAVSLNNLGMVCALQGDCDRARDLFQESLSMLQELEDWSILPALMKSFGILMAKRDDPRRAAQLLGAGESAREEAGSRLAERDREKLDSAIQGLRENLGDDEFKAEWDRGRGLSREEVLELIHEICN
jgi:non-specific serine/threonine protein kinase